ncbi:MAG: squalene/phytoene synthase family protein [Methylocystaceae bacterium]|nr:squalene/phytoene synthase family protein [Methylocystaceae bacterium]
MSKTENTENFPVASLFLTKDVRAQVLNFYKFARGADDIADSPDLDIAEKYEQLKIDTTCQFKEDLLCAFRQDVEKKRYETWDELMEYCRYSANPVGRFLLEIHHEEKGGDESDALCSALQTLNHLQDCKKDYLALDRIYLPAEFLKSGDSYEFFLSQAHMHPDLRLIFDRCLDKTDVLLKRALQLPSQIKNKRLRYQAKVTVLCGLALAGRLRREDPIAKRVELNTLDKLLLAYKGLYPL